jgi:hypothetical protein
MSSNKNIISNLIEHVNKLDKRAYRMFFRGHSDCNFDFIPSLCRGFGQDYIENVLIHEFQTRCQKEFVDLNNIEKMVKMHKFGLPTRLLNVTENLLIALYFACCENLNEDAELIFIQVPMHDMRDTKSNVVKLIADVSCIEKNISFNGVSISQKILDDIYINESNNGKLGYSTAADKVTSEDLNSVYCVIPQLNNLRFVNQELALLQFGLTSDLFTHTELPQSWVKNSVIIKKEDKPFLLNQLKIMGITHHKLFPEPENVALYLKEKFPNT